ncbi:MAG TPA: CHAD domain-containing protein [Acidobacteriaceae bacterium]
MLRLQETYDRMHLELVAALAECQPDARPRAVHKLRTTSRKLEALMKVVLFEHAKASKTRKSVDKVLDLLVDVRKDAGAVRDCDVQHKMVSELGKTFAGIHRTESGSEILSDAEELDKAIGKVRKKKKKKLIESLGAIEVTLKEALHKCEKAIAQLRPKDTTPQQCAMHWMRTIEPSEYYESEEGMHDFRRKTKGARYIAELQLQSQSAKRFARKLHSVHDAIGLWHDYAILAIDSSATLGKKSPLVEEIKKRRDHHWQSAVRAVKAFDKSG